MSLTAIKRPNYYEGQYLGAQDLVAAQEYQRQQDQRHRLAAHTWGIAVGLELEERPRLGSSDAVDVYLKPGYAVDGFGRAIAVLEPYKLPEALFSQFTFDPWKPTGRWVRVWLRYREEKTNPPRPGYAVCDTEDQAYRILETFRLVVGELPLASQQRDQISVAGKMKDAANERIPDASIPYQALPEAGDASRWLIGLGSVRWVAPNPPATTVGHFVKSDTDVEKQKASEGRPYVGTVAESVLAPVGKLRIRDRKNPKPLVPETPELLGIEGSLRVDGISHFRDLLITDSFVNIDSQNRNAGTLAPGPALTFGLLSFEGIASQRNGAGNLNGLDFYTANKRRLSISNEGNVGIGIATATPVAKLQFAGDLAIEAIPNGAALPLPANSTLLWNDGTWLRLNQNRDFSKPIFGVHTPGVFAPMSLNVGGGKSWGDPGAGNAWIMGNLGIGTVDPISRLHLQDSKAPPVTELTSHVAVIENTSNSTNGDVLALKVGQASPGAGNNFITFFGGNTALGRIEGNGGGGIVLKSPGADFAECLPKLHSGEQLGPGDVVGIFGGRITKTTEAADHVMVIAKSPIVLGNMPRSGEQDSHQAVAFLGQTPVKVRGAVQAGDYIVASGLNDGIGVAVAPEQMKPRNLEQVLGRAWASANGDGVNMVSTAVGFQPAFLSTSMLNLLKVLSEEIDAMRSELKDYKVQLVSSADSAK